MTIFPEYEQQLRDLARRTRPAGQPRPSRARPRSWARGVPLVASILVAIAVAGGVVAALGYHSRPDGVAGGGSAGTSGATGSIANGWMRMGCRVATCARLVVRWNSNGPILSEGGMVSVALATSPKKSQRTMPEQVSGLISNPLMFLAPSRSDRLSVKIRPCDASCGHLDPAIDCTATVHLSTSHPRSAVISTGVRRCRIQVTPGYGKPLKVTADHGIAGIGLGESSSAIKRRHGPGVLQTHPPRRTYTINDETVVAQFDHSRHVTDIQSTDPALTLDGQPLARGFGYWSGRLRARHWTLITCGGVHVAGSPSGMTLIRWFPDSVSAQINRFGGQPGCAAP